MDLKSKIILIYGPTASGKSKSALKLAEKINGEIDGYNKIEPPVAPVPEGETPPPDAA